MTTRQARNKPVDVIRDGAMKANIWSNASQNGTYFTVTFAKTYTDNQGRTQDSYAFTGTDLLKLSELSRQAYAEVNALKAEQSYEARQGFNQRAQHDAPPGMEP